MLNSPRLVGYHPYVRLVALLAAVKELEKDWALVEHWDGLVPKAFDSLTGEKRNRTTNASLGGHAHLRRLQDERRVRGIFAPWNRGLTRGHSEEAQQGQATDTLWTHVEVQAMGLSITEPRSSLQRSYTSKFAGSMSIHRTLLYLLL